MTFPQQASAGFFQRNPLPPPPTVEDYVTQAEFDTYVSRASGLYTLPEDLGAIGDGQSHPASEVLGVTSLADLRDHDEGLYAFAESIDDEMDWLAIQAAFYRGGRVLGRPGARYVLNKTLNHPNGRVQSDWTHSSLSWEAMQAIPDDGTNLVDTALQGPLNTLLEPSADWTFASNLYTWTDAPVGAGTVHFGQMGWQMHVPKGRWTAEATITLSAGASLGFYGPPYCGFGFSNDHVGQGFPEWPDPLAKNATLSPGKDGVPTYLSFDFEIAEEDGRTVWLTFSGGNCDITVTDVRVKPFRMNYAVWCSGDPMEFSGYDPRYADMASFRYDDSTWVGGVMLGPNSAWSTIYDGPEIGGFLHKSFQGDGARCNWRDVHIRKFDVGITLSDNAYLNKFEGLTIGFCRICVRFPPGAINAAENYRFTGCILFNSELAVDAEGGGEWFFFGTSWDYCRKFLRADRGAYIATHGVHIEGKQRETYLPVASVADEFDVGSTTNPNVITGGTSGATARLIEDKSDETWDEGPRVVVEHLSGTFASGETITGSLGGSAVLSGPIVMGDYMFDLRGGSLWAAPSGEILFAGYTHNGARHIGRVESNNDRIAFGNVWLYNLDTASGVTWEGAGRVTVERHLGPNNPNLAALWLENHNADAYAGMGDFTSTGALDGHILGDALPADGIPLDFYLTGVTGTRVSRSSFAPGGPSCTLDPTVERVTDGSSIRLDIPNTYGSGQGCNLRFLIPVSSGKIVMDRYFIKKPDAMPYLSHGPFALGTPPTNTATLSTTNGINEILFNHEGAEGLAGAGPQEGWTVTFTGLSGTIGGIPAASLNGVPLTIAEGRKEGLILTPPASITASGTTTLSTGVSISYVQKSFLVWDRRLWVKMIGHDVSGIPIFVQDLYQGELNYTMTFDSEDWRLPAPDGNRWWYTEEVVPDSPLDRMGSGRAPEWATHMIVDLNFWNYLYAVDGTDLPPIYLAGFFANVV